MSIMRHGRSGIGIRNGPRLLSTMLSGMDDFSVSPVKFVGWRGLRHITTTTVNPFRYAGCAVGTTGRYIGVPKRVIDADAMWASDKLARTPLYARREYPWLYGLADAQGCFEITNLRVIHGRVAAIREDLTLHDLSAIFLAFKEHGLLFTWKDETGAHEYAHWVGSDRPGRLPSAASRRGRHDKTDTPAVPKRAFANYLAEYQKRIAESNGIHGNPLESKTCVGLGLGLGSSPTENSGAGARTGSLPEEKQNPPKICPKCENSGWVVGTTKRCECVGGKV